MLKKTLAVCVVLLSTHAIAESAPDCSPDKDKKIISNLFLSLKDTKHSAYANDLIEKDGKHTITLLSSEKISMRDKKQLMMRRGKQFGFNEKDIFESGLKAAYLEEKIYRQYYKIELKDHPSIIAEYFSIPHYCAVDLRSIYFISETTEGFTPSFLDNIETPY